MNYSYKSFMQEDYPFKIQVRTEDKGSSWHAHDYFQLCYVTKGVCLHHFQDRQAHLVKGDFFSVPPGLEHCIMRADQEYELILIDFMPQFINESMRDLTTMTGFFDFAYIQPLITIGDRQLPKLNLSVSSQIIVEQFIGDIQQEMEERTDGYKLAVKAILLRLLVVIGREYKLFLEGRQEDHLVIRYRQILLDIFHYMEEHYHEDLSLNQMAERAHMSPTYFSKMFKAVKGQTYIDCLNELRMRNAMELLRGSELSVTEICHKVGFNHLGHFNRMFKKMAGMPPTRYRKEAKVH